MNARTPLLSAFAALVLLAACAQPQQAPTAPVASILPGCNVQAARFAVGYTQTDALEDEVQRRSGARVVRLVRQGQPVTMDFSNERINLELDAGNRVAAVRCG